jgi:opacity protein-like surface antigen
MEVMMQPQHHITRITTAIFFAALLAVPAFAQTSVGLSVYGAFSGATDGNGVQQSPSNSAGGLFEFRHISNPLVGWEATYSYNRANQVYSTKCGANVTCAPTTPAAISADAHEITGDWVPSVHIGSFRPFGVLGIGALLNEPAGSQSNATSSDKVMYVYGAGLDWGLIPHIGLRFQYRGNLYKAPDVTRLYTSTNAFTHTAEPMIGAYFSF